MKLLVSSDWHLDWSTHGVPRFDELEDILFETLIPTIQKEKITGFIFAGDLCDPDSGPVVFRTSALAIKFARRLEALGVEQLWIAGNHDVIEDGTGTTTLTPLAAVRSDLIHVSETPGVYTVGDLTIIALPFVATSHNYSPEEYVKGVRGSLPSPVAVVGHLSVPGVVPGEEVTEMPRGRDVRFPIEECQDISLLINGHYHRQQRTESGIWIPGSLARLTFGEQDHDPGFLIIEV